MGWVGSGSTPEALLGSVLLAFVLSAFKWGEMVLSEPTKAAGKEKKPMNQTCSSILGSLLETIWSVGTGSAAVILSA